MNLKKLNLIIATTFGSFAICGSANAGQTLSPGILEGSYNDSGTSFSATGASINNYGNNGYLTIGLNTNFVGFSGNISDGTMSAVAAAGEFGSEGHSAITYRASITNTGTSAQNYTFNIHLDNSQLVVVPEYRNFSGGGTATATIAALVKVNGSNVWSSSASLSTTSSYSETGHFLPSRTTPSYTFSSSGSAFAGGSVFNCAENSCLVHDSSGDYGLFNGTFYERVSFGAYSQSISLGTLLPGETEVVSYELSASTLLSDLVFEGFQGYGGAVAKIGDPFSTSGNPAFQISSVPASAVPEPESLAMMAAGLALVGAMARRRKQKCTA